MGKREQPALIIKLMKVVKHMRIFISSVVKAPSSTTCRNIRASSSQEKSRKRNVVQILLFNPEFNFTNSAICADFLQYQ